MLSKPPLATSLRPAPEGARLDPAPPDDVVWLRIRSASLPERNSGNQLWDDEGDGPDPYVVLLLDGKELLRTGAASDTVKPTWDAPAGNFRLPSDARLEVVVRDDDALGEDLLMGRAKFYAPTAADVDKGSMEVGVGPRGSLVIEVEHAHALFGMGFDYWVQNGTLKVTEVWKHSPAGRAGIVAGDRIHSIAGKKVSQMKDRAVRSALNAVSSDAVRVVVEHEDGSTATVDINVGPVYALYDEYGHLP